MKSVTICPATIQHPAHIAFYRAMARSHKATCDSILYFVFNEIHTEDHWALAKSFEKELEDLEYFALYYEEDFHLNKLFNYGLDNTKSDIVVYTIADTIFLNDWLNPLKLILASGKYHSAQGTSRENYDGFYSYRTEAKNHPAGIMESQTPCGYHFVMMRDNGYRWDEEIGLFYPDVLYREYLSATEQKTAIYAHSWVEHLGAPIAHLRTHTGPTWQDRELKERRLFEKWRADNWNEMKIKWKAPNLHL